jgi:hypothetical protein
MALEKLYIARDSMEAAFVAGLLNERDIPAVVFGEILGVARGELPPTMHTQPAVFVPAELIQQACEILDAWQRGLLTQVAADWTCPTCGEVIEGQFAMCWNCQTSRPE